uniref:Ymf59 n=1 Tax=Tetrahymena malaccensis TaxID=5901 RepID=Q09FA5_TETMA|nr:Ymf59 [Tetrahymena malaccensis]ABI51646.1 Ymf59 [Tetrahymena malaccensis]
MNNKIYVNIKYKMNFNPQIINTKNILSKNKINKIYCKNFIFTILFFDFFNSTFSKKFLPYNYSFHITKQRKHVGSILRAPYKNKIAQFSLGLYRYYLNLSFFINSKFSPILNNKSDFKLLFIKFLNSYNYFESTLVTQVSRTIKIPVQIQII